MKKAFERLQKEFPGESVQIRCMIDNFYPGKVRKTYEAYHAEKNGSCGYSSCAHDKDFLTPDEAVDYLVRMRKGGV